jgi:hypothetical protein
VPSHNPILARFTWPQLLPTLLTHLHVEEGRKAECKLAPPLLPQAADDVLVQQLQRACTFTVYRLMWGGMGAGGCQRACQCLR